MRFSAISFGTTLLLFGLVFSFSSCEKDGHDHDEGELITTVIYTLTPVGGGSARVLTFKDTDGTGGLAPVITGDTLQSGTNYSGAIRLLNEQKTPAQELTSEILSEAKDHQFFFLVSPVGAINITYSDSDANGRPLGLSTQVTALIAGNASIKLTLRHKPNKGAPNVSAGDITNAGGGTDVEVNLPVVVL